MHPPRRNMPLRSRRAGTLRTVCTGTTSLCARRRPLGRSRAVAVALAVVVGRGESCGLSGWRGVKGDVVGGAELVLWVMGGLGMGLVVGGELERGEAVNSCVELVSIVMVRVRVRVVSFQASCVVRYACDTDFRCVARNSCLEGVVRVEWRTRGCQG
ncbi:hypothetical protein DENSPDRAFT_552807 [Dentipellis sp. KUC8613]|nr:hypothetical protein DENSPDRAFT_552807 [Dentipellis sp. KUC8613]